MDQDGSQTVQLNATYKVARKRLEAMERQRAELDEAIDELKAQMGWAEEILAAAHQKNAAQ